MLYRIIHFIVQNLKPIIEDILFDAYHHHSYSGFLSNLPI